MVFTSLRLAACLTVAALAAPAAVSAQDRGGGVPYAGADLAYDYLTGEYYRYDGPRPQNPRAREQVGYRDGTLQTRPNHGYYAGVKWIGGYRTYRGCGCSSWYGRSLYRPAYDSYEPNRRENGYYERYASSNHHNWGYRDRRETVRVFNYGY